MIIPPIVTVDGEDVWVSQTARAAELAVEPEDVLNGIYTAYDSTGRLLRLRAEPEPSRCIETKGIRHLLRGICGPRLEVRLEEAEAQPQHASELAAALSRFLSAAGVPLDRLQAADLAVLIELVAELQAG